MMRERTDGTMTYTTPDWDERYYWPVGMRVRVGPHGAGVVVKSNATTVNVRLDTGAVRMRVGFTALTREVSDADR